MISIKIKKPLSSLNIDWFSRKVQLKKAFGFSIYRQCLDTKRHPLFIKNEFHTIHIDLTQEENAIQSNFSKTTKYEIRKAERDGVHCQKHIGKRSFIEFFNNFAKSKNRPTITSSEIDIFGEKILITGAFHSETTLVMHCYLLDTLGGRIRLLHSASDFRSLLTSEQRNLVARANRLLHYYDICSAKEMGIKTYDLGGYSVSDIDDERKRINDFKKSFGGEVIEEPDYTSIPAHLASLLIRKVKPQKP